MKKKVIPDLVLKFGQFLEDLTALAESTIKDPSSVSINHFENELAKCNLVYHVVKSRLSEDHNNLASDSLARCVTILEGLRQYDEDWEDEDIDDEDDED